MRKRKNKASRIVGSLFSGLILLVLFASGAYSRDVTFTWEEHPEDIDGFRLYYKTGSSGTPYDGTGANEGPSPVDTGNVTSFTLTGLSSTETYYFALTAYKGATESDYSSELVLHRENTPPTASDTEITVAENTAYSGRLPATDADNDPLTYSLVTNAEKGTVSIIDNTSGSFTYTPVPGATGSDAFTFKVDDGKAESAVATVDVAIVEVNEPPNANQASIAVAEDSSFSGQLTGSDPDDDPLTFSVVSKPTKGNASITNSTTGTFVYVPNNNATGSDAFTFKVNDGSLDSPAATVNVDIIPVNDPPVAEDATFAVDEDTVGRGQLSADDPDGDRLTYSIATGSTKGNVVITDESSGAFSYTPYADETGFDSFTFRANDGLVSSEPATVTLSITPVNDPPAAVDDSISTDVDTAYTGRLNGSDIDGDSLTFSIVENGAKGSAVVTDSSSGGFTYTPYTDESGSDAFTFRVYDGAQFSDPATVVVTINQPNMPPVAADISITTAFNTETAGKLAAYDANGDVLNFAIAENGTKGSAVIVDQAGGDFRYTPEGDASGEDSFTFRVTDEEDISAEGRVKVTILDDTAITAVFGENMQADYPGTVEDTHTNLNTENYIDSEVLRTYSWSEQLPHKVANTILLKVNMGEIPSYSTVTDAKLILYQTEANGEDLYTTGVHQIIGKNPIVAEATGYTAADGQPWTPVPPGTTYQDIPLGIADIEAEEDDQLLFAEPGFRSWTITEMVQKWINEPTRNYGLLIVGEKTSIETGRAFASSNNTNTEIRPQVRVHYRPVPPPPRLLRIEETQ